ncbi:hypothetical protein BT96DRAFT_912533 [Gymnopus androsaceus JB14]|uniref:BAG domain-containing protein n=1 Tax=Gymnopus androsaceus JB14 TaxID=1447944 RepID=A0A6A4IIK0_9AGAR|nr:hypothetical protein BT96DRAFT_912533 [Gymnopus androsaceus JB14]
MYRFQPTLISSLPNDLGYSQPRESYLTSLAELRSAKAAEREEEDLIRRLEEIQLQKQYAHRRSQGYRRSLLEDQELERAAAIRHHQQELELEYLRRTRDQEAQILALKRKEEEAKLLQLTRLREEEEARLRVLRRQSQQVEAARQAKVLKEKKVFASLFPYPVQKASCLLQIKAEPKVVPACRPVPNVNSEAQTLDQLFTDLIKQLHQPAEPRQKPAKEELKKQAPAPPAPTVKPAPVRESLASPQSLEDVLRLIFNPHETELASSSKPVTQAKPKAAEIEKPQQVPVPEPRPASSLSLKEQLEARLNNDQSVEIKDTIQALLASLSDSPAQPSSKGKGKAPEPQATSTSNDDAHKALESVRNIEASFIALQDEFDFPSDVDFSPAPSRSSSPARDDFWSRIRNRHFNHPQASLHRSLLSQLDDIESNGNADVRVSRKAIVALVEGALEDLEKKVEARWNKWHKSQVRVDRDDEEEVKANNDEAVEATEQPTVATDATVEPDVPASETVADVSSNPTLPSTSTSLLLLTQSRSSPVAATEVSSYAEVEPEPTVTEDSDSTQVEHLEEIISSQEAVIDIEASATQPEDDSNSGDSSVATIRDSDQQPGSYLQFWRGVEQEQEEQGQEESDADLSDTFLLPATDSNDFTSTSKRTEQDSEDMGSDWSEVEA